MNRVFITGDKHRNFDSVEDFCQRMETDKQDLMIVLGDNGVNYFGGTSDRRYKKYLSEFPITFMMIRGNHDRRPDMESYHRYHCCTNTVCGDFLVEEEFPDLLFAIDGETYMFPAIGDKAFVIGGAYSIDKFYRLESGNLWFPDEQLDEKEREEIGKKFDEFVSCGMEEDGYRYVFSHTCPRQFIPNEAKLSVPAWMEDPTMENWMGELYDRHGQEITRWFCGHWHICKEDGNVRFMYEDFWRIV